LDGRVDELAEELALDLKGSLPIRGIAKHYAQLEAERDTERKMANALNADLERIAAERDTLQRQLGVLGDELQRVQGERDMYREGEEGERQARQAIEAERDTLQRENEELRVLLASEDAELYTDNARLQHRVNELERALERTYPTVAGHGQQRQAIYDVRHLIEQSLDILEGDIDDLEAGIVLGSDHAANLYALRNNLATLADRSEDFESKDAEIAAKQSLVDSLVGDKNRLKDERDTLQRENERLTAWANGQDMAGSLFRENKELQHRVNELEAFERKVTSEAEYERLCGVDAENERLTARVNELEGTVGRVEDAVEVIYGTRHANPPMDASECVVILRQALGGRDVGKNTEKEQERATP